jgi:hypothetical protein
MEKKIRLTLTILATVALLSVFLGIGFLPALSPDYGSYKQSACMGKVLDFAQKGVIRVHAGGFSGGIYECMHMKYVNSIYGTL